MKPVIFHRDAEAEFEAAIAWYESKREGLGAAFRAAVEDGVAAIGAAPEGHARHKPQEIRKFRLKRFPFTIYFLELDALIWIAAVAHNKRRPDYWTTRDPAD